MRGTGLRAVVAKVGRQSRIAHVCKTPSEQGADQTMTEALRAFMTELIDYAGLFPPARLDLDPALRNYARYRNEADAWMLGRFIVPAARLQELAAYHDELFAAADTPFSFAVLAGGGPDDGEDAALARLQEHTEQISNFQQRHGPTVQVKVLETRLPDAIATSGEVERTRSYLQAWQPVLAATGASLFVEFAGASDWPRCASAVVAGIAGIAGNDSAGITSSRVGVKLRCGGLTAETFPAADRVALVIAECRKRGVPLKCTAGLHHPVRHHDPTIGVMSHGFLNVFGAGLLAHAHKLSFDEITRCLLEEDPGRFHFSKTGFGWQDWTMTTAEVIAARRETMISFGSCSFDEPREDLRQLGLLSPG